MANILQRLEKAKKPQGDDGTIATVAQMYSSIKHEIDKRSKEDIRAEVLQELKIEFVEKQNELTNEITRLNGELRSSKLQIDNGSITKRNLESNITKLESTITSLKEKLKEKDRLITVGKLDLSEASKALKDEIRNEKDKTSQAQAQIKDLELQLATLTGKLTTKKTQAPMKIPSFSAKPVRAGDGRIIDVMLTPVGLN